MAVIRFKNQPGFEFDEKLIVGFQKSKLSIKGMSGN
jgi:hypothetical protein